MREGVRDIYIYTNIYTYKERERGNTSARPVSPAVLQMAAMLEGLWHCPALFT